MRDRYHAGVTSFSTVYLHPKQGISMDQFRVMVNEHLIQHLGDANHKQRADRLMETADVNKDDKVTSLYQLGERVLCVLPKFPLHLNIC